MKLSNLTRSEQVCHASSGTRSTHVLDIEKEESWSFLLLALKEASRSRTIKTRM